MTTRGRSTNRTVLCVAESWGFGPSAKLFAILRAMSPRPRVVVACSGTGLTYTQLNADLVDDVIELAEPRGVLDVETGFDAVLTVMDPWAALVGARRGVPTFYVDSLFWFWNWATLDFAAVFREADRWRRLGRDAAKAEVTRALDWHTVVPMAYAWSSRVFVQRTPGAQHRLSMYPPGHVVPVGAVIAAPERTWPGEAGPPLVSVSGAISHTTPPEVAARYCKVVAALLEPLGDRLRDVVIVGHPALLHVFRQRGWDARTLEPPAMAEALAAAPFALTPAGLTTALEAAAVGTPLIFLPEQHAGHAPNRDVLGNDDPEAYDDLLLRRWFNLTSTDPAGAIADLDGCYQRLLGPAADPRLEAIRTATAEAVDALLDPEQRARRTQRQRRCALAVVGNFDGAEAIATAIAPWCRPAAGGAELAVHP